jgi:hypothetical protein
MKVRYVPNPAAEQEIRAQAEHQEGMRTITKGVARSVQRVAPDVTGYYKRRIRADGTKVRATDPFWHIVERGSVTSPPYGPLRRGTKAAGLKFVLLPKPY